MFANDTKKISAIACNTLDPTIFATGIANIITILNIKTSRTITKLHLKKDQVVIVLEWNPNNADLLLIVCDGIDIMPCL